MEKISLIVTTYRENVTLIDELIKKYGFGLHSDTYCHDPALLRKLLLQDDIKMYVHLSKTREGCWDGSGKVEYVYHIKNIVWDNNEDLPCPDNEIAVKYDLENIRNYKLRCWNYVYEIEKLESKKEFSEFIDFETGKNLPYPGVGRMLNSNSKWYYVYDLVK